MHPDNHGARLAALERTFNRAAPRTDDQDEFAPYFPPGTRAEARRRTDAAAAQQDQAPELSALDEQAYRALFGDN